LFGNGKVYLGAVLRAVVMGTVVFVQNVFCINWEFMDTALELAGKKKR